MGHRPLWRGTRWGLYNSRVVWGPLSLQVSLKQQTMADLATLRAKVEQTRAKLSEAEDTLQAEQAVHSTVVGAK